MSRSVLARMVALALVILLGGYFIFIDVLRYRIGAQQFVVTVMTPAAGGIYSGASVTYRGVTVGQVNSLGLTTTGVQIHIGLNPGTKVPANSEANVRELSALGEQYLDLVPPADPSGDLHSGSVIPASQVTTPVPIGTALLDLGSLLSSVNPADFRTVETFLTTAFSGTGPALRTLVVTGQNLFNALAAAQTANIDLIQDGQPVLNAFQQTDDQFGEFAQGLAQVTAQLKSSNADLKALIDNGTSAEAAVNPFLADNTDSLESTIQSLGTSSGVAQTYQPEVQALFQVLPLVASNLAGSAPGGQVRGELAINTEEPVCPYEAASEVPSPETPEATVPMDNGCTSSLPGLLARGFKG